MLSAQRPDFACHLLPAPFTPRGSGLSHRAPEGRQVVDMLESPSGPPRSMRFPCKTGEAQRPIRRVWEDLEVQDSF